MVKESACNAGDPGSIPGLGRLPGGGKGYPLQYSGLENSMDCTVHGVAKSWTQLSDFHFTYKRRYTKGVLSAEFLDVLIILISQATINLSFFFLKEKRSYRFLMVEAVSIIVKVSLK